MNAETEKRLNAEFSQANEKIHNYLHPTRAEKGEKLPQKVRKPRKVEQVYGSQFR